MTCFLATYDKMFHKTARASRGWKMRVVLNWYLFKLYIRETLAGTYSSMPAITSVDLKKATASTPSARPSSATASLVMLAFTLL